MTDIDKIRAAVAAEANLILMDENARLRDEVEKLRAVADAARRIVAHSWPLPSDVPFGWWHALVEALNALALAQPQETD